MMRINKYLAHGGVCSRRDADTWIAAGRVRINGEVAGPGDQVDEENDIVTVDGREVSLASRTVVVLYYKPVGVVCSEAGQGAKTIYEDLKYPSRLAYAGRLDKDSEGLMLLSNDGDLIHAITKARHEHEKEYEVTVNKPIDDKFVHRMSNGVPILDTVTRPCKVEQTGDKNFSIILTQGLNRQIRRMCEACGYRVKKLKRVRILNQTLGDLKPGAYRELTDAEVAELKQLL